MKPETKRERRWFCSNPVPLKMLGGKLCARDGRSDDEPVAIYNTAAIIVLTADRSIPS